MKMVMIGCSVLAVMLTASAAQAVELKNLDSVPHMLVVVEGQSRQEVTIAPSQTLADLCKADCSIWVGTDPEPYELKVADKLVIENAQIFYADQPGQDAPAPGDGQQSPPAPQ